MRASQVIEHVKRILGTVELGPSAADTGETVLRVAIFPDPSQPGYHQVHGVCIVEATSRAPLERDRGAPSLHRLDVQVVLLSRVRSMTAAEDDIAAAWDLAERTARVLMDDPVLQVLPATITYQGVTDDGALCAHLIGMPVIVEDSP